MLELQEVETYYGSSQALFGVGLKIGAGQIVSLLGRNGMGKTTTVHSVMGITPPSSGKILFEGQDLFGFPSYKIARKGIGLVPEGRQIFPNLTVQENLVATANTQNGKRWTEKRIYDLFPSLALRKKNWGNQLSGGEQQMLAIGRALMTNPKLLILDEATEGLAPKIRQEIWDSLEILKQDQLSILLIDKTLDSLLKIADHHFILEKGRVVWSGKSDELNSNPDLKHRYLGV